MSTTANNPTRPAAPFLVPLRSPPIHFSNSKLETCRRRKNRVQKLSRRAGCAVKIQKVFRGFLVRKWMKKIKDIKVQVDQIEEKLSRSEVVELIRRDEKERLRISETLMSLLLKLDSIRGVDLGVRVCRKGVIRKAIALQERIDAIVETRNCQNDESIDSSCLSKSDCIENSGNPEGSIENPIDVRGDLDLIEKSSNVSEKDKGGDDESKRNREVLEKMMKENEKMMRLINALTNRVQLLEKNCVCDKKKKNNKNKKGGCTED